MAAVAVVTLGTVGLAACSPGGGGDSTTGASCAELTERYGTFPQGTTVTVATSFTGEEAARFDKSVADFATCTGLTITQVGGEDLEQQMRNAVAQANGEPDSAPTPSPTPSPGPAPLNSLVPPAGSQSRGASASPAAGAVPSPTASPEPAMPDLAILPQPGLITDMADAGLISKLPDPVGANVELGWDERWSGAGKVNGALYAAPVLASVKSLIWFSPDAFARAGYTAPTTWSELQSLTDKIVADQAQAVADGTSVQAVAPWCLGSADSTSSGWALSDWLEDSMLATRGTGVYDSWVSHSTPLGSEAAVTTLEDLDSMLLADGHTVGGRAGVTTTTMAQAAQQLVDGQCLMLHASSSLESSLPDSVKVVSPTDTNAPAGALSAFATPSAVQDVEDTPVLVGGDFLTALKVNDATTAAMEYLTSAQWVAERMALGGVATANHEAEVPESVSPVVRSATETLQKRDSLIRVDASDMMPSQVGEGALWSSLNQWASGELGAQEALDQADAAWPPKK